MEGAQMGIEKHFISTGNKKKVSCKDSCARICEQDNQEYTYNFVCMSTVQKNSSMHLLVKNKMYCVSFDSDKKKFFLKNSAFIFERIESMQASQLVSCKPASLIVASDRVVKSPLAGRVVRLLHEPGEWVTQGQPLVVVESMKMENEICASQNGIIKTLFIALGNLVQPNQPLLEIEMKGGPGGESKNANDQAPI